MIDDMLRDDDQKAVDELDFTSYTEEFIRDFYTIVTVTHLDGTKPIYIVQDYNYHVRGEPADYLTNSPKDWLEKQPGRNKWSDQTFGNVMTTMSSDFSCKSDSWRKNCVAKFNKELPKLELGR